MCKHIYVYIHTRTCIAYSIPNPTSLKVRLKGGATQKFCVHVYIYVRIFIYTLTRTNLTESISRITHSHDATHYNTLHHTATHFQVQQCIFLTRKHISN